MVSSRVPPPCPGMPCGGRAWYSGGAPSSSSWFGGSPPSLSGMPCAWSARCRFGGSPPFSVLRLCPADALSLLELPLSSCLRAGCVHCWGDGPLSSSWSWPRGRGPHYRVCRLPPRSLAARHGHTLLGRGPPPLSPPLAATCVKRARRFKGSPSLVSSSLLATRWERALLGFVPFLQLLPVLPDLFPCGLVDVLAPWVPCVGWIDRRPRWHH